MNEAGTTKTMPDRSGFQSEWDRHFDDFTLLACQVCGTPAALISLVGETRRWCRSPVGIPQRKALLDREFWSRGISQKGVFEIRDTLADETALVSPLVTGEMRIRFYAGAPVLAAEGHVLAMLCVADRKPRHLTRPQKQALQALARHMADRFIMWRNCIQLQERIDSLDRTKEELGLQTAFFEAQANASPDAIIVVDQKGRNIHQNKQVIDLFKIPHELANEKDDAKQLQWVMGIVKDPATFAAKVSFLYAHRDEISKDEIELKDGRFLDRYSSPVIGKDGGYYGRIWIFREITERKLAEQALRESEARFSGAFEFAPIGMALVSPEGRWLKVNRTLCDMLGYAEEVLLALTFQEITHPGDLATDLDNVRQLLDGAITDYQMEKRYVHADGHEVAALLDVSLVRDDGGPPLYFIAQIQDISVRKKAASDLRESRRFFRSALDSLSSHIAILDEHGCIIEVNAAWKRFASENGLKGSQHGVGENYIQICSNSSGGCSEEGSAVADGILGVMTGRLEEFKLEYPCHGPGEQRWFICRATRFSGDGPLRVVVAHENITSRKLTEENLQRQQAELQVLFDLMPAMIWFKDTQNGILRVNKRAAANAGMKVEEIEGRSTSEIYPKHFERFYADDLEVIRSATPKLGIIEKIESREGRGLWIQTDKVPFVDASGSVAGIVVMAQDITDRVRIEAQLIQSQKMDTVGKLAGGIAHEFNSILTAIIGQSDILLHDLPGGSSLAGNVCEISKAAGRAVTLTRQLLAYSRRQMLKLEILDLNGILSGMGGMLSHIMGEAVDIRVIPAAGPAPVRVDSGQMEQVIINMVINARDAMPNGGKLTIETMRVSIDPQTTVLHPDMKPGDFVMLAITDTGAGMSEEVKAHIFEPFYTTKVAGEGTGLGLSTCYGIIKQSGGHITVYSEPGLGTSFKIYLPEVEARTKVFVPRPGPPALPHGTETILLVEDDPALREVAAILLERLGYTVLAAANGLDAVSLTKHHKTRHIDLLFTDVVMPNMSGRELAERMQSLYSHTRVLFTSAYTGHSIIHQGVLNKDVPMLQKPYSPSALAIMVREVLDQKPVAGSLSV